MSRALPAVRSLDRPGLCDLRIGYRSGHQSLRNSSREEHHQVENVAASHCPRPRKPLGNSSRSTRRARCGPSSTKRSLTWQAYSCRQLVHNSGSIAAHWRRRAGWTGLRSPGRRHLFAVGRSAIPFGPRGIADVGSLLRLRCADVGDAATGARHSRPHVRGGAGAINLGLWEQQAVGRPLHSRSRGELTRCRVPVSRRVLEREGDARRGDLESRYRP